MGEGIINFHILILYFSVHFIKNAYFALLHSWLQQFLRLCVTLYVQSSDIIYKSASGN